MIKCDNPARPNEDKVKYRLLDRSEPARFSADTVIGLNKSAAPVYGSSGRSNVINRADRGTEQSGAIT
jgi:hypothetical protein